MQNTINFLLDNAGPVIKYRTITELIETDDQNLIEAAKKELLQYSETKKRFNYLRSKEKLGDFNGVHGALDCHLENSLPMLLDFGVRKGMTEFDEIMYPVIKRLQKKCFPENHVFSKFIHIIIVPFLYKAGFREKWIKNFINNRLETLYNFTVQKDYDIYDNNEYKGMPPSFQDRKVIKPNLYTNGEIKFPLIYDIYGLSEMIKDADKLTLEKIETIIDYILDSRYSQLANGYGILLNGNRRYLAMGWDAKLPQDTDDILSSLSLHRLELMANFNNAVNHNWFQEKYKKLKQYNTQNGTFILPKTALQERKGCWVIGRHMSLGENRRKKLSAELESTFRVLKIDKILQTHKHC